MKYIDTHCHLQFEDYDLDRELEIQKMKESETAGIVVGVDIASSKQAIKLAEENEHLFACVGVHPTYDEPHLDQLEGLVKHPKVVAIGECGFDFYRTSKEQFYDRQKILFDHQIDLAIKYEKPLVIHSRNTFGELFDVLSVRKKEVGDKLKANIHFFTGNIDDAKNFLDLGFTLSFSGVITFARDYDESVRFAPLSRILVETDAPYVAPIPFRGKRNNPRFVSEVVSSIAKIREEDEEEIRMAVLENAKRVFNLNKFI